jgi:hypothetical protein
VEVEDEEEVIAMKDPIVTKEASTENGTPQNEQPDNSDDQPETSPDSES